MLLAEVVTVDDRDGHLVVGRDAGYNVTPEHFIYGEPTPFVAPRAADEHPAQVVTVAGNINEGDDLWAEDQPLPDVREGDILAILRVGSYNQSMHLDHSAAAGGRGRVRRARVTYAGQVPARSCSFVGGSSSSSSGTVTVV